MNNNFSVIPSVRDIKSLNAALDSANDTILLSTITHIGNLKDLTALCHKARKKVIVNHELVKGLGNDSTAFDMLKKMYKVDAVIENNPLYAGKAKSAGMETVLKVPLIDSLSMESALKTIGTVRPDALEVKPAVCALAHIDIFKKNFSGKIFASGFINSPALAEKLRNADFHGIMTSMQELWHI